MKLSKSVIGVLFLLGILFAFASRGWTASDAIRPEEAQSRGSAAGYVNLYDDPRVKRWSGDYLAGRLDEVLASVEKDLKSPSPHPFAPHVWTITLYSKGRLESSWKDLKDSGLRDAIAPLPDIYLMAIRGEYKKLREIYPPSGASKIKDAWALNYLVQSALDDYHYEDALKYLVAMARLQPDNFQAAWLAYSLIDVNEHVRSEITEHASPGGELSGTPFGRFVSQMLRYRPVDARDELASVNSWLAEQPHDARALSLKGNALLSLERPEEAAMTFAESETIYGFQLYPGITGQSRHAEALVRSGNVPEALKLVKRDATVQFAESGDKEADVELRLASALIDAGEMGGARRTLDRAAGRWPDNAALMAIRAKLETQSERYKEGAGFSRRAASLRPDNLEYRVFLIETLRQSGDLNGALRVFTETHKTFAQRSLGLYWNGSQTLAALKKTGERVRLCEEGIAEYPDSAWMHRDLADALWHAGRKGEALERIRIAMAMAPAHQFSIGKVKEYVSALYGAEKAGEEMNSLRARYPWVEALWNDAASGMQGPDAAGRQIELWKKASEANPGRNWPLSNINDILIADGRWDEAARYARDALSNAAAVSDKGDAVRDMVWVVIKRSEREHVDGQTLEDTLRLTDEYYKGYSGHAEVYYRCRSVVLRALGREKDAAEAALKAAKLNPDRWGSVRPLVTQYAGELKVKAWVQMQRYADRDPYDGKRLANVVDLHAKWGGSPLVALLKINELRKISPDLVDKDTEAMVWGKLGDHAREFEMEYGKARHIAASGRYVAWYDDARLKAQSGSMKVEPDYEAGMVKIAHPDGQVVIRKDHPISGKPVLIKSGAAYLAAEYDESGGNILRLTSSSGAEMRLTYDEKDRITMIDSDGVKLRMEYNEMNKPVRMSVEGIGDMTARYRDDGEIDEVKSPKGREVALKVIKVFQELTGHINQFGTANAGDIPDLRLKDKEFERLWADYARAKDEGNSAESDDPGPMFAAAEAGIKFAGYAMEHAADSTSNVSKAYRVLTDSIGSIEKMSLPEGFRDKERQAAMIVEAVTLWHRLMGGTASGGLSAERWADWVELQALLNDVKTWPGAGGRAEAALEEMGKKPLRLAENARWLPKSSYANPVFWRDYMASMIFGIGSKKPEVNVVLARQNGDVAAGSDAGLAVLRHGVWERYGFDEAAGAFKKKGGSPITVLSLAESVDGALWVGTENGLFRIPGEYEGPVTRWRTQGDGLPAERVGHLAAYGKGVLAGTAKGLRFLTDSGAVKDVLTEFADKPVTVLKAHRRDPHQLVKLLSRYPFEYGVALKQRIESRWKKESENADSVTGAVPGLPVLLSTGDALYGISGGRVIRLADGTVGDAVWSEYDEVIYMLRDHVLDSLKWNGNSASEGTLEPVRLDTAKIRNIHGIDTMTFEDGPELAILSDNGVSVYKDGHVEQLRLPSTWNGSDVRSISVWGMGSYMAGPGGILVFDNAPASWT